jgi:hypothetical protein
LLLSVFGDIWLYMIDAILDPCTPFIYLIICNYVINKYSTGV